MGDLWSSCWGGWAHGISAGPRKDYQWNGLGLIAKKIMEDWQNFVLGNRSQRDHSSFLTPANSRKCISFSRSSEIGGMNREKGYSQRFQKRRDDT